MKILETMFSVKNNRDKTHKIITFLGIKIKIKKKFDKNAKTNNFGVIKDKTDVVILGNGPSLKDSLDNPKFWEFIKDKDVVCVNTFPSTESFLKIKPSYLVLMDHGYWCKNIIDSERALIKQNIDNIKNIDWDLYIFMPIQAKKWNWFKEIEQNNEHIKLIYINADDTTIKNDEEKFLRYKTNIFMPSPQNVLIGCLYCSINIGYKNIYIFGADHTWHLALVVRDDNLLCIKDSHFYDKEEPKLTPLYKNPEGKDPFTMREIMRAYMIVYEKYEVLEKYSKYMGSKIYNMSKISCIDAFERKKLEDV